MISIKAEKSEADLFYLYGVMAFSYASEHYCKLPYPWFKKKYDGNQWCYLGNMETGKHRRIGIGTQHSANLGSRGGCSHIADKYLAPLMPEYSEIVNKFILGYKKLFPKHLHDDADRMCHHMFRGMYAVMIKYAQRTEIIKMPSPNCYCDVLIQFK